MWSHKTKMGCCHYHRKVPMWEMEHHFEVLPVTPPKLVKRILKEEYADMAELLNNNVKLEHYQLLFKNEVSPCMYQSTEARAERSSRYSKLATLLYFICSSYLM